MFEARVSQQLNFLTRVRLGKLTIAWMGCGMNFAGGWKQELTEKTMRNMHNVVGISGSQSAEYLKKPEGTL